jgi:ribosomal protein L28
MGGVYAMKNKCIGLVRKSERKGQTDRTKRRWDANIKTDSIEAGKESVDLIHPV